MTVVGVMHANRSTSDPNRAKYSSLIPSKSDIQESSVPSQDANIVMALFNPMDYANENNKLGQMYGYDVAGMNNRFRVAYLLKNREGDTNKFVPLLYTGENATFSEIALPDALPPTFYGMVTSLNLTY